MLKKFILNSVSSFVGAMVALMLFGFIAALVIIGVSARFSSKSEAPTLKKGSVLVINLGGEIAESDGMPELSLDLMLSGNVDRPQLLRNLVSAIRVAADEKKVKAIYLKCDGALAAPATLKVLRDELISFKKSGKKIYAYGDNLSQGDFYVASIADSLFMNPEGSVSLRGVGGTALYYKDLFDKLGVRFTAVKVGTFKSAVEPFTQNEMSAPARAQLDTLYGALWTGLRAEIANSRKLKPFTLDTLINSDFIMLKKGDAALKAGLVDALVYERTMDGRVAKLAEVDKNDINYLSANALSMYDKPVVAKKKIAVLYAVGEIQEATSGGINCNELVPIITELADDEDVSGMVLRVNSPGGSVFGSVQIADALSYFQSKGKPLAVAMGDYAASGGYWISAEADRIFASNFTVTGSIGIFGLIPDAEGLMHKIGVSPQTVMTNPAANFPALYSQMTPAQAAAMQSSINEGYDQFIERVAKGRKMSEDKVRAIAEGRVWIGSKALELGLVDQIGTIDDATKWVAKKADVGDKYSVEVYPKGNSRLWDIIASAREFSLADKVLENTDLKISRGLLDFAEKVLRRDPIQARMLELGIYL